MTMEEIVFKLFYWAIALFIIFMLLVKFVDIENKLFEIATSLVLVASIILFGFAITWWSMDSSPSDLRDGEGCSRHQFDTRC